VSVDRRLIREELARIDPSGSPDEIEVEMVAEELRMLDDPSHSGQAGVPVRAPEPKTPRSRAAALRIPEDIDAQ